MSREVIRLTKLARGSTRSRQVTFAMDPEFGKVTASVTIYEVEKVLAETPSTGTNPP